MTIGYNKLRTCHFFKRKS